MDSNKSKGNTIATGFMHCYSWLILTRKNRAMMSDLKAAQCGYYPDNCSISPIDVSSDDDTDFLDYRSSMFYLTKDLNYSSLSEPHGQVPCKMHCCILD